MVLLEMLGYLSGMIEGNFMELDMQHISVMTPSAIKQSLTAATGFAAFRFAPGCNHQRPLYIIVHRGGKEAKDAVV
jgi:hypothetical protein